MERQRHLLFVLIIAMIICMFSCNDKPSPKYEISQIELATGECNGECPLLAVKIDSTLSYMYFGGQNSVKQGYYKGKISQKLWDSIVAKLTRINFDKLDTAYQESIDDQELEAIIIYDKKRIHIISQGLSLPSDVKNTFYEIIDTYKEVNLSVHTDSIKFDTHVQYPIQKVKPLFPPDKPNKKYR